MQVKLHEISICIQVKRAVRQGDTFSPKIFITVLEYAFKALDWYRWGINTDGHKLSNLQFSDDIFITTDGLSETIQMLYELS